METPRNILAPTDFSEMSNGSAAYAAKLAIAMNSRLHLHHVVHEVDTAHPLRALDDAEKEGKEKLAAILSAEEKERLNLTSYVGFGPRPIRSSSMLRRTTSISLSWAPTAVAALRRCGSGA